MTLADLAITIGKQGAGDWELRLESGETVEVTLDEVEVSETRGFHAEGRSAAREVRYELTTGPQPGGPIELRRRHFDAEDWVTAGEVVAATKLG